MVFAKVILLLVLLKHAQSADGEHEYEKTLVNIDQGNLGGNKTYSADHSHSTEELISQEIADRYIDILTVRRRSARPPRSSLNRRRKRMQRRRLRRLNRQGVLSHAAHVQHAPARTDAVFLDTLDQWEDEALGYSEEESSE